MEELFAHYRIVEAELDAPEARFRREYEELRAIDKMEAALKDARQKLGSAASRLISAR